MDRPDPSPADFAGVTLLGDLPPAVLARVLARSHVASFAPGDVILTKGATNETLHVLLSGLARIHFDLADRAGTIPVPPGRIFGELSVIDGLPVSAFVIAAEPSRVLLVPAEVFWAELVTAPGAARMVMRSLSRLLRDNAAALTAAMQEHLRLEAFARELSVAREIQMGLLRRDPLLPGETRVAVAASIQPAKEVGGDLYEVLRLDDDHLLVAIGDVSGKGISAALFMVRALTLLRSAAGRAPLPRMMAELNDTLAAGNDAAMFVTMFVGVLDLGSGAMEAVSYGHCPPVLRGADGVVRVLRVEGSPGLGMLEGVEGAELRLVLEPGATLLLYSDGVTEAMDAAEAQFGTARLLDAAAAAGNGTDALVADVAAAVARHAGEEEQADDITLLALAWRGAA